MLTLPHTKAAAKDMRLTVNIAVFFMGKTPIGKKKKG
jgi:hypothetical protein